MMRLKYTLMVFSLLLITESYSQVSWIVDNTHGNMGFSIKYMGLGDYSGRFKIYDGKIQSKTETDFTDALFSILIDINSVSAVVDGHEEILKSEDFFDAAIFPFATFRSTSMKPTATKGTYVLTGDLTIRGITKKIELSAVGATSPVINPYYNNTNYGLRITGKIKRSDFGIGSYDLMDPGALVLSDEVVLVSTLILVKSDHKIPMIANLKNINQDKGLEKYQGQYDYGNGAILSVTAEGDRLFIQKDTNYRKQIFIVGDERFIYEFYDVEIEFNSPKEGEVDGLTVIAGSQKTKSPKISSSPRNNLKLTTQDKESGSSTFLKKSWEAIMKKNYSEAIEFCLAGLEQSAEDLPLKINLAHAYLFSGSQGKAIKIYKENMSRKHFETIPFSRLIQQDFIFFASRQYPKDIINNAYKELNLIPVEAYKNLN